MFRFATELAAWVATPWWLWHTSWVLSVLSLIVLIGLPTVFATPGEKAQVMVAVPGWATVLLVLMELAAAVVSARAAVWPLWAAVCVSVLAPRPWSSSALGAAGCWAADWYRAALPRTRAARLRGVRRGNGFGAWVNTP
ncbi:hypothetical protein [Actinacidiphila acidipaludis]|uniref:hypothetical protein n=1 Tax=Actinacidiphila acidipaludis TaxID=2873382 RepID=UPI00223A6A01|nr:hypothetical protein [Streptomyces acidipaludis]